MMPYLNVFSNTKKYNLTIISLFKYHRPMIMVLILDVTYIELGALPQDVAGPKDDLWE